MTLRAFGLLPVAIVISVLAGSGLAALAEARPNDPCSDFGYLPEGSTSDGSFELWPLRLHCEYRVGSRLARSTSFGPQAAELYAWIGAATLLAAFTLLRRESAFLRGASPYVAIALAVLAFAGVFGVIILPMGSIVIALLAAGFVSMRFARPLRADPLAT